MCAAFKGQVYIGCPDCAQYQQVTVRGGASRLPLRDVLVCGALFRSL
jgi:hypothetical protein